MGDVVGLDVVTRLNSDPDRVVENATGLSGVVVIGYDGDGDFYFVSSYADGGEVLWLLELAKKRLFEMADDMEGA